MAEPKVIDPVAEPAAPANALTAIRDSPTMSQGRRAGASESDPNGPSSANRMTLARVQSPGSHGSARGRLRPLSAEEARA